jgi:hypothetical protein
MMRIIQYQLLLLLVMVISHIRFVRGDWENNWGEPTPTRVLEKAFQKDPHDDRTMMRGSGSITLGDGKCIMTQSPRLYIAATEGSDDEWGDLEMTAYGEYKSLGTLKSHSGLTLVAKSRHSNYKTNGCDGAGYYARIYAETGEASFQKEYYHAGSTVYSSSNRKDLFEGGLKVDQRVGMKFRLVTVGDAVQLDLFVDTVGDGSWTLAHSLLDDQGAMPALKSVPSQCPIQSGDPIVRLGTDSFLRSDGSTSTVVHWTDAKIEVIRSGPTSPPTHPQPTTNSPTKAPIVTLAPTTSAPTTSFQPSITAPCCSFDFLTCGSSEFCNESETNCQQCGGKATWMVVGTQPGCIPRYKPCGQGQNGECCAPGVCVSSQCKATTTTSTPTANPTSLAPVTDTPTKTPVLTSVPTYSPTSTPVTDKPTESPTSLPTKIPTDAPTTIPTLITDAPTKAPIITDVPTTNPTSAPVSRSPTNIPTSSPKNNPTSSPVTVSPTKAPVTITLPPTTLEPTSGNGEYCCSMDYSTCSSSNFCNESEMNCGNCGSKGAWMIVGNQPGCIARWNKCTNNPNGCCSPGNCVRKSRYFSQCK